MCKVPSRLEYALARMSQLWRTSGKGETVQIFVFGSNLAGRHGKGAALEARKKHGAIYGIGYGLQGQSFAIPTKDKQLKTLPLSEIKFYVGGFLRFAQANPSHRFEVTRIGCGLAGYTDTQIAPLFRSYSSNCVLPDGWKEIIADSVLHPDKYAST